MIDSFVSLEIITLGKAFELFIVVHVLFFLNRSLALGLQLKGRPLLIPLQLLLAPKAIALTIGCYTTIIDFAFLIVNFRPEIVAILDQFFFEHSLLSFDVLAFDEASANQGVFCLNVGVAIQPSAAISLHHGPEYCFLAVLLLFFSPILLFQNLHLMLLNLSMFIEARADLLRLQCSGSLLGVLIEMVRSLPDIVA